MEKHEFNKVNGTVVPGEQKTAVGFVLHTTGTPEQLEKTLTKIRKELSLQGFVISQFTAVKKRK